MKKNVGALDRLIRSVLAVVLLYLYASGILKGVAGIISIAAASILIITSITGYCFLYTVLGINTNKKPDEGK